MRSRSQSKTSSTFLRSSTGTTSRLGQETTVYTEMMESKYPGPCNVQHWKILPTLEWSGTSAARTIYSGNGYLYHFGLRPKFLYNRIAGKLNTIPPIELNREKLKSTSDFGLLQFLFEADQSLEVFTTKFWKQFSYGSFTWALLPFISEARALCEQLSNAWSQEVDDSQSYEDELTGDLSFTDSIVLDPNKEVVFSFKGSWTRRLSGRTTTPDNFLLELFDRMGFHPDIATAWDLVPFSFVVDYIFNIGDALEMVTNRGWIKCVNFTGWETIRIEGTVEVSHTNYIGVHPGSQTALLNTIEFSGAKFPVKIFRRYRRAAMFLEDEMENPTAGELLRTAFGVNRMKLREIFNIFYLHKNVSKSGNSSRPVKNWR